MGGQEQEAERVQELHCHSSQGRTLYSPSDDTQSHNQYVIGRRTTSLFSPTKRHCFQSSCFCCEGSPSCSVAIPSITVSSVKFKKNGILNLKHPWIEGSHFPKLFYLTALLFPGFSKYICIERCPGWCPENADDGML